MLTKSNTSNTTVNSIFQNLRGYQGNDKILMAGQKYQYTQQEIAEFVKCSQDIHYFIENYMKIVHVDHGLVPFNLYGYQKKLIDVLVKERYVIGKLPRQVGKALPLTQRIPTPNGWTTMGELSIGDYVLSPSGNPVKVVFKTPTMYNHDCYDIEFDNGEVIKADAEHLWEVNSSYWNTGKTVKTTEEIFNVYEKKKPNKRGKGVAGPYYIEHSFPQIFEEKSLHIDPYQLGVWLGDGDKTSTRITCHEDDYPTYEKYFDIMNKMTYSYKPKIVVFSVNGLNEGLNYYGLKRNKHIPIDYLRSSFEQRLSLLQGLMDTDGSLKKNSRTFEFYQKDHEIITQFRELLSSLGIKSRESRKSINGVYYYTVRFTTKLQVFRLQRKLELIDNNANDRVHDRRIYITSIKKSKSEPVACIKVDSEDSLFLVGNTYIPTHNSSVTVAYLLWYVLFTPNAKVVILAHRAKTARELFGKVRLAYENLPKFLQAGIAPGGWNKSSITLGNGSSIHADATSSGSIRGESFNIVVLDEFAFVPKNLADEFMESVFPTISSGQTTKLIIMSTPKGMNKFYDIWKGANETDPEKKNSFVPVEIKWNEPPGRDDQWKAEQVALIGPRKWRQEYEANFVGTSSTLIDGDHLEKMMANVKKPITIHNGFRIYETPKPGYKYSICVDVSRGLGLDYHAFTVVDVTNLPYKLVAVFQDNTMYPTILPNVIADTAKKYNNAHILVEISDIGQQVADMLIGDLDCDNVIRIMSRPGVGQVIGFGFAGKVQNGLKTSNATKKVGAMDLKTLIESGNLIIEDEATVNEFLTFVANSTGTYSAEAGYHDDLVMTFVLFGWLSHQRYFREEAHDIREIIQRQQEEYLDSQLTPFGIFDDGVEQIHYDYGDNTFGNF